MSLNNVLLWIVVGSAILSIIQTIRDPITNSRGWIPVSIGTLVISIVALLFFPQIAGYIGAGLWIVVGIVPTIGFRMSNRRFYQGDYEGARQFMSALRWLHPIQDWPMQEAFYRAFQSVSRGNLGEAKEILAKLKSKDPRASSDKEWRIFYLTRDWDGLIDWWRRHPNKRIVEKNAEIVAQYLRALGETGDLNAMLYQFEQYKRTLERTPNLYHFSSLYIFALCGRIELTRHMMDSGILEGLDSDMRIIWLATAECAFGNREAGRELVKPLLETKDYMVRIPAQKCASGLVPLASERLTPESLQILSRIEQEWSITHQLTPPRR